jgi:GxxExxY protein
MSIEGAMSVETHPLNHFRAPAGRNDQSEYRTPQNPHVTSLWMQIKALRPQMAQMAQMKENLLFICENLRNLRTNNNDRQPHEPAKPNPAASNSPPTAPSRPAERPVQATDGTDGTDDRNQAQSIAVVRGSLTTMNSDQNESGTAEFLYREVTQTIIGAAFEVHRHPGYGFLEKVYQRALQAELQQQRCQAQLEYPIKVKYKGVLVGEYFADLLVEGKVIVELKVAPAYCESDEAQLINQLISTGLRVGLLFNFGRERVEFKRLVN